MSQDSSGQQSQQHNMMNMLMQAAQGNKSAVAGLVNYALPQLRGHLDDIEAQVEYHRENEWMDEAEARELALKGELTPEQAIGAYSDLMGAILRVTAYAPIALVVDSEDQEAVEDMLVDAVYSLVLTANNPVVKYGIVGGMRPEVREEAVEYLDRMGNEVWGSALALTSGGRLEAEDFPPETRHVIRETAEAFEADAEQR
jgi:uncharacterized protein with von Willebrand factor type A (vWA) domain